MQRQVEAFVSLRYSLGVFELFLETLQSGCFVPLIFEQVFGSWNGTTQLFRLMYNDTDSEPFGRSFVSEVAPADGDGHVVRAATSKGDVAGE